MNVTVRGETFRLTPEHCLFWPRRRLLAVADLHLGQSSPDDDLWTPHEAHARDLARLELVAEREGAEEIVFLGDFAHSAPAVTPELVGLFSAWREDFAGNVTVLLGHHDRSLDRDWPAEWDHVPRARELSLDGFAFRHEVPMEVTEEFVWAGHVHPVVKLSRHAGLARSPCYFLSKHYGLLPAFSRLAGGFEVWPSHHQRVFAPAGGHVLEVAFRSAA